MIPNFLIFLLLVVIKVNLILGQDCSVGEELEGYKTGDISFEDGNGIKVNFNNFIGIRNEQINLTACGSGGEMKYSTFSVENNQLILVTKNMDDFEEITMSGMGLLHPFCVHLEIDCDNFKKDLIFYVNDTNNHAPYFVNKNFANQSTFTIEIPIPFPPNIGLDILGHELWARDIDLSGSRPYFDNENNNLDFTIIDKGVVDDSLNKVFSATLVSKKVIYTTNYAMEIRISNGPFKAVSKVTIKNKADQNPVQFLKSVYEGEYAENTYVIKISEKIVCIQNIKYKDLSIKFINEDYGNNFSGSLINHGILEIIVKTPIERILEDYIILKVHANDDELGKTVAETLIVLKVIRSPRTSFEEDSYEGELDLINGQIEKLPEMKIINIHEYIKGRIQEGEYEDKFSVTFDDVKNTFELDYIKEIYVEDEEIISFKLEVVNDNDEVLAHTLVIFSLTNKKTTEFMQTFYEGKLDLSAQKVIIGPYIKVFNPPEDMDGKIKQGEHSDKFNIDVRYITMPKVSFYAFFLTYDKSLDFDFGNTNNIALTIEALNSDKDIIANTVVILTLINKPIARYAEDFYEGEFDLDTGEIEILPQIKIENPPKHFHGKIEQGEYEDKFDVIFDETKNTFKLVSLRPIDVEDKKVISFTLQAVNDNEDIVATTIVILTLVNIPTTLFEEDSYEGELDLSTGKIGKLPEIKIKNPPTYVTGFIEKGEYEDKFRVEFDDTKNTFMLDYIRPIDVGDKKVISFKLEAVENYDILANTLIILTLTNIPTTRFENNSYEGELDLSTNIIKNLPDIKLENAPRNVEGRIGEKEYQDKFSITFDATTKIFKLDYTQPIDIEDQKIISFTLEAVNEHKISLAKTVVIFTLINIPRTRFEEDSYEGELDLGTGYIKNLPEIKIENPPENIEGRIEKGEYHDKFGVGFNSKTNTFNLVLTKLIDVGDKKVISFRLEAVNQFDDILASTIVIFTLTSKASGGASIIFSGEVHFVLN